MMASRTTTDFQHHYLLTKVLLGTPTVSIILQINCFMSETKYLTNLNIHNNDTINALSSHTSSWCRNRVDSVDPNYSTCVTVCVCCQGLSQSWCHARKHKVPLVFKSTSPQHELFDILLLYMCQESVRIFV